MDPFLLLLVFLLVLSGFFSGIESAFISLGEIDLIEIEKSDSKNRKILLSLIENKERLLSTILIGNNLVNIAASAINTTLAIFYADEFGLSEEMAVTLATVGLTLFILMFGEISPKSISIVHKRKISLFTAPMVMFLSILFRPASFIMEVASGFLTRLSQWGQETQEGEISEDTVINVVQKGEELGSISEREKDLIQKVFLFDEREVYPIMTPRTLVFALPDHLTLNQAKKQLMEKQFSRVPLYHESIDQITGILNLKTALKELVCGNAETPVKDLAFKASFIPQTLSISQLLERFQKERSHIAIVVDEYGGMAGIVTLEDILEELVGEIYDEKDDFTPQLSLMGQDKWLVSGRHDLVSINQEIPGEIIIDGDYESVQGLIMSHLNDLPQPGDHFQLGDHVFRVMKMRKKEILTAMIEYSPQTSSEER